MDFLAQLLPNISDSQAISWRYDWRQTAAPMGIDIIPAKSSSL